MARMQLHHKRKWVLVQGRRCLQEGGVGLALRGLDSKEKGECSRWLVVNVLDVLMN